MLTFALGLLHAAPAIQDLPHELYQLENGLTVILHEDHSAPQVVVNLWYDVGSKDEARDRTGFAHLFEHLMFMGTDRAPNFDVLMEGQGGWNNASTSSDRTNYYDVGPAEMLPTLLWLEADRLESLSSAMTLEKLDLQRAVVLNEYRQNYENRPYAKAGLAVSQLLYPAAHPYHIPTIGLPEHIVAATVDDVVEFFETFYVPSNASLLVAGDFDPALAKPLIEELFGTLARGDDPPRQEIPAIEIDTTRRRTLTDSVRLPMVTLAWHSPAFYAPGDAEMDLVGALLGDEPTGRLYERLVVQDQLAAQVFCYQSSALHGSEFMIQALALPGADLGAIEAAIDEELARFVEEGPSDAELAQHRASFELGMVAPLDSVRERADLMQRYHFYFGEPDALERDLDRYRAATAESVRDRAAEVFGAPGRAIVRVLPAGDLAAASNPRDVQPPNLAPRPLRLPEPAVTTLSSGVEVRHFERMDLPLIGVRMLVPGGSRLDPPGKQGLVSLTFDLLDEGAGGLDAAQLAREIGQLGANLSIATTDRSAVIALDSLPSNFEQALDRYYDVIRRPALEPEDFARVQRLLLESLASETDDPAAVAGRVERSAWYGPGHPAAHPPEGGQSSVAQLTRQDVEDELARQRLPERAILFSAGPIGAEEMFTLLEQRFGDWTFDPESLVGLEPHAAIADGQAAVGAQSDLRIVFCDTPGATQTQVRFVGPAPAAGSSDQVAAQLLATVLGGTFTSRLNQNLREDKGWTYGARARYEGRSAGGRLLASASVQADQTGPSIAEFLREFEQLRAGDVSAFELSKSSASQRQRTVEQLAGLDGLLGAAIRYELLGLPLGRLAEELDATAKATAGELNGLAPAAIAPSLLVLVGDAEVVLPQIAALREVWDDLPEIDRVDVEGNPLAAREASAPR